MPTKDKTQVTTHLPNHLAAKLKEKAKADRRTVSALLALLIEKALAKHDLVN